MCPICYCDVDGSETFELADCGHRFCRECVATHVRTNVMERLLPVKCPHSAGLDRCPATVCEEDIAVVCGREMVAKAQEFTLMLEDRNYRRCPSCGHMQVGDPAAPAMVCEGTTVGGNGDGSGVGGAGVCGHEYCFEHGDAHAGRTCEEFDAEAGPVDQATLDYFANKTKVHVCVGQEGCVCVPGDCLTVSVLMALP